MILGIDVGNSSTTVGLFSPDGTLSFVSTLETAKNRSRDRCAMDLLGVFQLHGAEIHTVDGAIVSCVVPPLEENLLEAVTFLIGKRPLVVGPGIRTGLDIRSDLHNQLGSDIVATSVAAVSRYPSPVIVVDLGTATTVSLLRGNVYEGCAILPGIRLGLEALSEHAAELPHISLEAPPSPLGHNTIDAMRSGVIFGGAGMVESMIDRFESACGQSVQSVVATGGSAPLILPHCRRSIVYDRDLLLHGLYLLYQKNAEKHRKNGN